MRRLAGILVIAALALGALGAGVGASFMDSASAALNINVGTFSCSVSSTDPNVTVVNDHSITFALPLITSSAAGSSYVQNVKVTNSGSMPELVHWTFATGGTIAWSPSGRMSYATDSMSTDATLAGGASQTYTGNIGFVWTALAMADLGQSAQLTMTANCGEVPTVTQDPNAPGFSGNSMTFTAGVAGSQVVNATPTSGTYKAVLSKTGGTLPFISGGAGLTYTAGTGTNSYKATIAGTPGCAQIGSYPLNLKATNSDVPSGVTETFNVSVVAPSVAPSLSFTMNSPATGSLGGPGANSFQVYGDIHNNSASGGVWCSMTLSIPYTITTGFTPVVEPITSIWAVGSSSVSGGNIIVTIVNPYVTYSLFGPGGAKLNVPIIYLDGSPTYGATITLGTPVVTATS